MDCTETVLVCVISCTGKEIVLYDNRQYGTISRGGISILDQLRAMAPDIDPSEYISFHSLRTWGQLDDRPVTSQICVHSQVVIADDSKMIIGTANVNDRSLKGDRDSEIGVYVDGPLVARGRFNGRDSNVSPIIQKFRKRLWTEHLGLQENELSLADDPLSADTFDYWKKRSKENTTIFETVFPEIPSSSIKSFQEMSAQQKEECPLSHSDKLEQLSKVFGHLVDFPLDFLSDENLRPDFSNVKLRAVDRAIFQ